MKTKIFKSINRVILVLVFLVVLFTMVVSAVEAPIILRWSSHDPPTGIIGPVIANWLDEIERQTDNKVKIQAYWGGALFSMLESLKSVADGVADISFVYPDVYPKQLAAVQVFQLIPWGPIEWESKRYVYQKCYEEIPAFKEELKSWNQRPILTLCGLPLAFCSRQPLTGIDDMKGKKWRAASKWNLEYLKNAGAIPTSIPSADVFMALQTGTLDGTLTNIDGMYMNKQHEAAPNVLATRELWMATPWYYTINLDTWNSLPKEIQEGILEASRIIEESFGTIYEEAINKIIDSMKAEGSTVNFITEEDVIKWVNEPALEGLEAVWIKETEEAGVENASEILQFVKEVVKEAIEKEK